MKDFVEKIDQINSLRRQRGSSPVSVAGPVSLENIQKVENQLGVIFPNDYKDFLKTLGAIGVGTTFVLGIKNHNPSSGDEMTTLGQTSILREESAMPHQFVAIENADCSAVTCINTADTSGNCQLVYYDAEEKTLYDYPHSKTFREFFEKFLNDFILITQKSLGQV